MTSFNNYLEPFLQNHRTDSNEYTHVSLRYPTGKYYINTEDQDEQPFRKLNLFGGQVLLEFDTFDDPRAILCYIFLYISIDYLLLFII